MPKYSTENKQIIKQIIAIGKKRGESKKEIKAALLTGRVEANFSNPKGGDRDSQGWRQERKMYYKNPTNVKASINRFFDETSKKGDGKGMNSGQLAQAVQRSAFPDRYNMHSKEAEGLLRRYGSISGGKSAPQVDTQAPGRSDALRTLLMQSVSNPSRETALTGSNIATALLTENPKTGSNDKNAAPIGRRKYGGVVKGGEVIGTPRSGTHTIGNWQSDNALDVGVPNGTLIRMPKDGVVEKVKGSYGGGASRFDGYQVTVRLKDGNRVFFTHLSKASVRAGQRLKGGAAIGRSGSANGVPHLHYGVERGNPRRYLK